jgi:putative holliday junction resolvase
MKNFLGIDYGYARIGLAVGDDELKIARPLTTLESVADPLSALKDIVQSQHISGLVLGLPRGLDGQETQQTVEVRAFASQLESLGLPIHLQDEAATSSAAAERSTASKRKQRKAALDAEAASIILQDFLYCLPRT